MAINSSYAWGKGMLKLLLVGTCCAAFACWLVADDRTRDYRSSEYKSRYDYFLFTHVAGAGSSILIWFLFLFAVTESCGSQKCWAVLVFFISIGLAVACVVAGGLTVEYAKDEKESFLYDLSDKYKWKADHRIASVAAAFVSSLLFFIDAIIHFKEVR
ncbi:uncharacterized protein LOC116603758 [Nematostella vectensis]|uniref:uncharacterized protein LOC116603758 n=1 Tax=Nematostella vectensis TaxID=45351 RepID=UPI00138FA818|nr:uncharacterized protein LOC116603758 [Nematostella vectensis]